MTGSLARWFKVPTMPQRLRGAGIRADVVDAAELTVFPRHSDGDLPALARSLDPQETVLRMLEGRWKKASGLVVLTDHRLVLFPPASSPDSLIVIDSQDLLDAADDMRRGEGVLRVSFLAKGNLETVEQSVEVDQILGNQAKTMTQAIVNLIDAGSTGSQPPAD